MNKKELVNLFICLIYSFLTSLLPTLRFGGLSVGVGSRWGGIVLLVDGIIIRLLVATTSFLLPVNDDVK